MSAPKNMRVNVSIPIGAGRRIERVGVEGGALMVPFEAAFEDERLRLTITIDVADGVPVCKRYQVERLDAGGLEMMTTDVARGIKLRNLMSHAIARAAFQAEGERSFTPAHSAQVLETLLEPVKRRREPASDERLREFAETYNEHFVPGHMEELGQRLHTSERNAWRLLKLARDRGFLPPKEDQ